MGKGTKKTRKIVVILFILLVAGPGLTYALLRNSTVQTYLVKKVASYLSKELDTRVEVGGLDISFFLNVVLEDVSVDDQQGNPMMQTKRMVFDIGRISIRNKHLTINKLFMEEAYLALRKYSGDTDYNFRFFIDYFSDHDGERHARRDRWGVVCKSLAFVDSHFIMKDDNVGPDPYGFDKHHMHVADLNLEVQDIFLQDGALSFFVEHLSLRESRGFAVNQLSGLFSIGPAEAHVTNLVAGTPNSRLSLEASMTYDDYADFADFHEKVHFSLAVHQSQIDMADLGYFVHDLYGMSNVLTIHGEINGVLSDLHAENFSLSYGMDTHFAGSLRIMGLPDPGLLRFNFFIDDLHTSVNDIAGIRLPHSHRLSYLFVPPHMFNLGKFTYRGQVSGQPGNMFAQGRLTSDLGDLHAGLNIRNEKQDNLIVYNGQVSTSGFNLGGLLDQPDRIGWISLNAEVEGQGIEPETLELKLNGNIADMELFGYNYSQIAVAGALSNKMFNGSLQVNDPNVSLDFLGMVSFEEEIPVFNFNATVAEANLTALNLYSRLEEAESVLSANMSINASGANPDNIQGQFNLTDLVYEERFETEAGPVSNSYISNEINLINTNFAGHQKHVVLRSDFVDASLAGEVIFEELIPSVRRFVALHLPSFLNDNESSWDILSETSDSGRSQNFQLKVLFKDTDLLSELFLPSVRLSLHSAFYVDFDSSLDIIDITGRSDYLTLFKTHFLDWSLLGSMSAGGYQITSQSSHMFLTDSLFVENFCMDGLFFSDTLWYEANWQSWDDQANSQGHIQGIAEFLGEGLTRVRFLPSYAMVNNNEWRINPDNEIFLDSARLEVNNLVFYNDVQLMRINGVLSHDPIKRMHVYFHDFAFSNMDAIVNVRNMNFGGIMNGVLSFTALYQPQTFETSLSIDQFVFNYEHLGDMTVQSVWEDDSQRFRVHAALTDQARPEGVKPLLASGYIFPGRTEDQFDIDILLDRLPLSIWGRYLEGVLDGFQGFATGRLRLEGGPGPALSGRLFADHGSFRVDYLNVGYTFDHQVEIGKDFFSVDNLVLTDSLNNTALVTGTIRHEGYRDFSLDVLIRPERLVVLNTTLAQNELYYGRAFVTGLAHIHGPDNDIVMDISARTNRGTQIFLPLSYTGEVVENNFITFVSRDTIFAASPFPDAGIAGLTLNFDLDVTPDAEVQLIFGSQIGDVIRGRGSGDLKLEINSQGAFNMYGEYNIQEGDYLFTLQNVINKRFRIEQGGVIRWTGDPNDADIDLRAAYRLRTSLYDLMMDVDTSDFYRRRVPIECILVLQDNLVNPSIAFEIQLPGGDEGTRDLIERRINTEQEMNRQVFSLLVLNRFMPTATNQYNTALGYGVGSTSSELLSNQLSNWLSQISSEFDIGVNYRPGDQISSQELEVALSTQLFDDRVLIDGNVGVAGTNPGITQRTSNIIGDVNIEVKITPEGKFRVKAFNRSNTFDVLHATSPYTQGLGIFYRREFDSLSELFRRSVRSVYSPEEAEPDYSSDL